MALPVRRTARLVRAWIVVSFVMAGCGSATMPGGSTAANPHDGSPAQSAPASSDAIVRLSVSNQLGSWALSHDALAVYSPGEHTWKSQPLPTGLTPDGVEAILVTADGYSWIAADDKAGGALLFVSRGGPWRSGPDLDPSFFDGLPAEVPAAVLPASGSAGAVTFALSHGLSHATSVVNVFQLDRDRNTATRFIVPKGSIANMPWDSMLADAAGAVVTGGPANNRVIVSQDGGAVWTDASLSGLAKGASLTTMSSVLRMSDGSLVLPVFSDDAAGASVLSLLKSSDGGQTFAANEDAPRVLSATYEAGTLPIGSDGRSIWILSADARQIEVLADGAWSTVKTSGLPADASGLAVLDDTSALASISAGSCTDGKSGCSVELGVYASSDGGRTWREQDLP